MIPVSLTLENFTSHLNSHLDFTQFEAALLVGTHEDDPDKSNGSGKSSIFDAICWALYGKSRFAAKDRVVHRGKQSCSVEFVFQLHDGEYKVARTLDIRSKLADVTFYKKDADEWESKIYTADTNTATTRNIIDKLGISYDAFVNVVYFKQNDIAGFAATQTGKRKDILQDILQIGMWNKCQKDAKEEGKRLSNERDALVARINGLGDLEGEMESNLQQIEQANKECQRANDSVAKMEHCLHEQEEEIANLEITLSQTGKTNRRRLEEKKQVVKNKADANKERRKSLKEKVQRNNSTISNHHNEGQNIQFKVLELSKKVMVVEGDARNDIEQMLSKMGRQDPKLVLEAPSIRYKEDIVKQREQVRATRQQVADELKVELKQLLALKPGKQCPTCLTDITDISAIEEMRKQKKAELDHDLYKVQLEVDEVTDIIDSDKEAIRQAKNSYMEIQRLGLVLAKHQTSINEAERHNSEIQEEFVRLREEWQELKEKNSRISDLLSQTEDLNEIQIELDRIYQLKKALLSELEGARKAVIECSVRMGHLEGYKEELERRVSEKEALIQQKDELSFDVEAYSSLIRIFGRDGIQAIIMENVTEDLRSYTNSTLRHLSNDPMTVDFITQRQQANGSWREDFDINILIGNELYDFNDLSGGEQVRVAFALRLALSRILMRRVGSSIRFLLLDEVDQSLDKHGIDVLAQTIHGLTDEFKIVVITHNEYMKEKFEHVITVQKGSSGSTLRQ